MSHTAELAKHFKKYNVFELPEIVKVSVNSGIGRIVKAEKKNLDIASKALSLITGQKPIERKAKKSIANFNKLRAGEVVGITSTLRGKRAEEFLNKLITIVLPRTRDFKGINFSAIDQNGNLSVGIKDFKVFPEVDNEAFYTFSLPLQVNVSVKALSREDALKLYEVWKFPIKNVYKTENS
jgi:large subunit ribosomal protein L5